MIETNNVLLVNVQDKPIGEMEKLVAHQQGCLTGHFRYLFLMNRMKFSFNKELMKNITEQGYGQIPVVRIHK